mmetsp:Transcript_53295/g.151861  ORF Transcript_53295/g.151861 Transcript_53295/m.151861 type:complete len:626 (-) Transcript_53295:43-1920(-)
MSLNMDALSEPVKREWQKLQHALAEASQRHLQEQEILMAGFLDDVLRINRHVAGQRAADLRGWRRSADSRAETPGRAETPQSVMGYEESACVPTPTGRYGGKEAKKGMVLRPPKEDDEDAEWLGPLRSKKGKVMASLADEERDRLRSAAQSDVELTFAPLWAMGDWVRHLQEPRRRGCLHNFNGHWGWRGFCWVVILVHGVYISLSTQLRIDRWKETRDISDLGGELVIEAIFLSCYWLEVLLKLFVHRLYFFVNDNWSWNIFDVGLAVLSSIGMYDMLTDSSGVGGNLLFVRISRLCKVGRLLRLVKAVHGVRQLRLMLGVITDSLLPIIWASLFLLFTIYLFAVFNLQAVGTGIANGDIRAQAMDSILDKFGSLPICMLSLLEVVTNGEHWSSYYDLLGEVGTFAQVVFIIYIMFFAVCVWNIFSCIFVQQITVLARPDLDDLMSQNSRQQQRDAKELLDIVTTMDTNKDNKITLKEFLEGMARPRFRKFFEAKGLGLNDAELFFDMLSTAQDGSDEVDFKTFVTGFMHLKGMASAVDLQALHIQVMQMRESQDRFNRYLARRLKNLRDNLEVSQVLAEKSPGAIRTIQQDIAAMFGGLSIPEDGLGEGSGSEDGQDTRQASC